MAVQTFGKVIGTVTIGLMAGASMSSSLVDDTQQKRTIHDRLITPLSFTTCFALVSAFVLSPKSAKHPYLLYSAVVATVPAVQALMNCNVVCPKAATKTTPTTKSQPGPASTVEQDHHQEDLEKSYDKLDSPIESMSSVTTPMTTASATTASDEDNHDNNGPETCALKKLGACNSVWYSLAFVACTVGIYGDWA